MYGFRQSITGCQWGFAEREQEAERTDWRPQGKHTVCHMCDCTELLCLA